MFCLSIERLEFNAEKELHDWVEENIQSFFGDEVFYVKGFQISTKRNKNAVPDGFILDLKNSSWTIIESELLKHGVWDHIAEQIMRFIIASKSEKSKKKIRNGFFERIDAPETLELVSRKNKVSISRIIQKI